MKKRRSFIIGLSALCLTALLAGTPVLAFAEDEQSDDALSLAAANATVKELDGADCYGTAAAQADYAYPDGATTALIATSSSYGDALSGAGLAGALDCPILYVSPKDLPSATKSALEDLGVSHVIILGGTASVSDSVRSAIEKMGITVDARLWGEDQYGTQLGIYDYGVQNSLWTQDSVIVATGGGFGDALSVSPVAFSQKIPIFLTNPDGSLPDKQREALVKASTIKNAFVVGGTASVTDTTLGFLQGVVMCNGGSRDAVVRVAGKDQYATSNAVANWAVKKGWLDWDKAAFASGTSYYDALSGAVVQGKDASVLFLVDEKLNTCESSLAKHKSSLETNIKFFGGAATISGNKRESICSLLGITYVSKTNYTIMGPSTVTVDQMVAFYNSKGHAYPSALAQVGRNGKNGGAANIRQFCEILLDEANKEGVRAEVVFCQAMHETGWLQFGGAVNASQFNFGGLGAVDSNPVAGSNTFDTVRIGLRAQVQHLKAYASTNDLNQTLVDQRFNLVQRACAPSVQSLSQKWASSAGYGDALVDLIITLKDF